MSEPNYPIARKLDSVFNRVLRYGKPVNRCFTDLTAEEQEEFLSRLGEKGAKRVCLILAESLRTIGDQLDLYAEDNE